MSIKSDEVNFLVYRYLLESGRVLDQFFLLTDVKNRFSAFCIYIFSGESCETH